MFPGYIINEIIYEGIETTVYRASSEKNQTSVIIKALKAEYPSVEMVTRIKHEFRMMENLNLPGVIQVEDLQVCQNRWFLVMEDIGGVSLGNFLQDMGDSDSKKLGVGEFLQIAVQLAQGLISLHQEEIIHKDIKPANIIINPQTGEVKITDLSIASRFTHGATQLLHPEQMEGTLAYMSPEQTGRMNRSIDYRSDFYSLGVTFYEMLAGCLPFTSQDALELVHCHIAKQAPPLQEIIPEIPLAIAAIVDKLMAKNAEERYQTADGLLKDLEDCFQQWQRGGRITNFQLGKGDRPSQLLIPQKLYGREKQVQQILAAFERVNQNNSQKKILPEMILVSGYSGIGKSSLVNEVHKPIVRQKGYFVSGKFDQLQRNIPYASIIQALQSLIQQILTEDSQKLTYWRQRLHQALGDNGQIMVNVIPELEYIIGKQPMVAELGITETQNRFIRIFQSLIRVFAAPSHPLVIFLDDLQWADSASLNFLQILITNPENQYLLLIGAYRDNEVSAVHPLMKTISLIREAGISITNIILSPLNLHHIQELVRETLVLTADNLSTEELAELLFNKTQGNPFFLNQLLKILYQEKLLTFDINQGGWQWDLQQIQAAGIGDKSIVELMAANIHKLPSLTQSILQKAACIGAKFTLDVIAAVSEKRVAEVAVALDSALHMGLILPLNNDYRIPLLFAEEELANFRLDDSRPAYRFLHDRVQQAAYSLIPESEKQHTHYHIGQLLLQNTLPEAIENNIFDIVNQFNMAIANIDASQKLQLAELNLIAGSRAKSAAAYDAAYSYLRTGFQLLSKNIWQEDYKFALRYHEAVAQLAYLCGDFAVTEDCTQAIAHQATSLLDIVAAQEIQILANLAQNRLLDAVDLALKILKQLGIKLPSRPNMLEVLQGLVITRLNLLDKKAASLIDLPEMRQQEQLAAMRILSTVTSAAYLSVPNLLPLLVFSQIRLSVKYGNTALSAVGYAQYGFILSGVVSDIATGFAFGQLALAIVDKFRARELQAKVLVLVYGFNYHWQKPLGETLKFLESAYQLGLETGEIEYTTWAALFYCMYAYYLGRDLQELHTEISAYRQSIQQLKQEKALTYIQVFEYTVNALLDKPVIPLDFALINDDTGKFFAHLQELQLKYLFGDYQGAIAQGKVAVTYLQSVVGTYNVGVYHFYQALALLAVYPQLGKSEQQQALATVNSYQRKLEKWAKYSPTSYQHKVALLVAEKYGIFGQKDKAMAYYERAIALAQANNFLSEVALAYERTALFYLSIQQPKIAKVYMTDAYYNYLQWGATAKVKQLQKNHPDLIIQTLTLGNTIDINSNISSRTYIPQEGTISENIHILDLATLLKASETIQSSLHIENLPSCLLQIIIENTGAQTGFLVLQQQEQLIIVAMHDGVEIITSRSTMESANIPHTLINYAARTYQPLVINDAQSHPLCASDSYILTVKAKSVLCFPIFYQGKFIGLFYLENRLTTGAFTPQHWEILKILASQAAIALHNSQLYTQEQQKSLQLQTSLEELQLTQTLLQQKAHDLETAILQLQQTQSQLVHTEKISSLGQLVAGVAHEVNNPVGFISGNLDYTQEYVQQLIHHLQLYQQHFTEIPEAILQDAKKIDLDYLITDLPKMIDSMQLGASRITDIMQSLRNFSRNDGNDKKAVDIHEGINTTIMILSHRLKAKATRPQIVIVKEYGDLPLIECYPGQLNQVFMNLIANAIDALEESNQGKTYTEIEKNPNTITINTSILNDGVCIRIADNGMGMSQEVQDKLFNAFFTTKPEGKGTGLGLSISYQIVTEKHGGSLKCNSAPGKGAEFIITLPGAKEIPEDKVRSNTNSQFAIRNS
ncbi:ATP-binding sensor histidine kinase [Calothrix sp. 336/3]|uniref:ATP-binding sensor histidine kinase n=1 Tax=Calothrix sp. 336/3 TaxID=1337936 RepID=UPI001EDE383F|nr:ATP-binding sensor histidine kinase [Calothrix sp. 336/3]